MSVTFVSPAEQPFVETGPIESLEGPELLERIRRDGGIAISLSSAEADIKASAGVLDLILGRLSIAERNSIEIDFGQSSGNPDQLLAFIRPVEGQ